MKVRKILSLCMALVMIFSLSLTSVGAATDITSTSGLSQITGSGSSAGGNVNKNVWSLVVPTVNNEAFKFIADPYDIIEATDGAAFGTDAALLTDAATAGHTLMFPNYDAQGNKTGYSNLSDTYTVTSKSSFDIDITATVKVGGTHTGAALETTKNDGTFTDNDAHFWIGAGAASSTVGTPASITTFTSATAAGAALSKITLAAPSSLDDAFEVVYDAASTSYKYQYTADARKADFAWPTYTLQLKGAANQNADWSAITTFEPSVTITWEVTHASTITGAQTISMPVAGVANFTYTAGQNATAAITFTDEATSITALTCTPADGTESAMRAGGSYSITGNTLTILAAHTSWMGDKTCTFKATFNDGTVKTFTGTAAVP